MEHARANMIEQQIRPWDVLDQTVLDLLYTVRREEFVPPQMRSLAFADTELPLRIDGVDTGETMMSPKVEARLLQELGIQAHETVLEVGTGSGYMTALAAHRARSVLSIEIDGRLCGFGTANLQRAGIRNANVQLGDGALGCSEHAPYDVIIISGSLPVLPDALLQQLRIGGRIAAIVGDAPAMTAQIVTRISETATDTLPLFETCLKPLRNAWRPDPFRF
ncbi:MAG: protein-L-isoaspartate O-methyltransferase [Burkholderiaceae bacterium]|nr:protein-L-isoaspartate O-methyltransferase [Burkholderiaceae bacterium]